MQCVGGTIGAANLHVIAIDFAFVLFDCIAGYCAADGAEHRCDVLAATATHLMASDAANDGACYRTDSAVGRRNVNPVNRRNRSDRRIGGCLCG